MTRIVTTHYRYKPPPRKRKAAPLAGPAVVTPKQKRVLLPAEGDKLEPASAIVRKTKPGNDNRPDPAPVKSAIVTPTGKKRLKLLRADERATEQHDPEEARVDEFLARMVRPGGALPPRKPGE
jgi:hypothetical protein